jgi:hypothetical protein
MIGVFGGSVGGAIQHVKTGVVVGLKDDFGVWEEFCNGFNVTLYGGRD